jgi:hypothetical protein
MQELVRGQLSRTGDPINESQAAGHLEGTSFGPAIEALALEAMSRDLDIGGFIGQVLVAAINKDMIQEILR